MFFGDVANPAISFFSRFFSNIKKYPNFLIDRTFRAFGFYPRLDVNVPKKYIDKALCIAPLIDAYYKIATLFVSAEIYAVDQNGKIVEDDPLVKLIKRPNDKQNFQEFGIEYIIFLLSAGWLYQYPYHKSTGFERDLSLAGIPGSENGIQLFNLNPDNIEFDSISKIDTIEDVDINFFYNAGANKLDLSYSDDIIPYYDILRNPKNPFKGVSRLKSLDANIRNYLLAQKAKGNQIKLSGHTIVSPDINNSNQLDLGLDQISHNVQLSDGSQVGVTKKDEMYEELSQGGLGTDKPLTVASKPLKSFNLMEGLKDFDFDKFIKEDAKTVLNTYGIPKEQQGIDRDATTYENIKNSKLDMCQNIVEPIAENFCLSLQQAYNHPNRIIFNYKKLPFYSVVRKEILETKTSKINNVINLKNEGIYSVEQAKILIDEIDKEYISWS